MKALLIDGYVDEPALFGVPPYISTYVRYAFAVAKKCGYDVVYTTIDELRKTSMPFHDLLLVVGGVTVPGNYIGGTPMTVEEARNIATRSRARTKILIGSMAHYHTIRSGGIVVKEGRLDEYDFNLWKDFERQLYSILCDEKVNINRYEFIDSIVERSADLPIQHISFPDVVCEIELGMGCERKTHCSFCTEPLWGSFTWRTPSSVVKEVSALYKAGVRHFRLGRISNIFAYAFNGRPNPDSLRELYEGIREVAPNLKTLHTDNANPAFMYSYMKESEEMVKMICEYNTPGDVLSMGVESFDERVVRMNNLKILLPQLLEVLKMVNIIGAKRIEGVPKLLPGLNLLFGLPGETKETYKKNFSAMMKILDEGLMVRRVNVRKAMAFPQTLLFETLHGKAPKVNENAYKHFKYVLRQKFDHPMLKRVFPRGTILRNVVIEKKSGNISYGRQLGTYPILVGIPQDIPLRSHVDCVVVDHGQRSLTALTIPVKVNDLSSVSLKWIPGFGKKTVREIEFQRPFRDYADFLKKVKAEVPLWLKNLMTFE